MDPLPRAEVLIAMLFAMVTLTAIARRLVVPVPIVLVLGGLALGLLPGVPDLRLEPDLVFLVFLPPILWSAAYGTSLREFKENLRPILQLAFGLVIATTVAIGTVAHALLPGIGWPAALALGAIVSPPDAVAATAMARRLGLPRRIVAILEGESLVNDASALMLYRTAVAAAAAGGFSLDAAAGQFVLAVVGGVLIGLAVAGAAIAMMRRLYDSFSEIGLSLVAPYAAWLLAERIGASSVLACVAGGMYLRQHFSDVAQPATRVQARAVWQQLVFLLNGVVFILIGLQVGVLRGTVLSGRMTTLLWQGLVVSLVAIGVRLVWVPLAILVPPRLFASVRRREPPSSAREVLLIGWTGLRGVVSLAAALALPFATADGRPFPHRAEIVVITFVVILVTLVLQGLSLPPLVRRLGLPREQAHEREEAHARARAATAALERLARAAEGLDLPVEVVERLREVYVERLRRLGPGDGDGRSPAEEAALVRVLRAEVLGAERRALIDLRDREVIGDEVLSRLEHELNLEAMRAGLGEASLGGARTPGPR
jgi:CPA1 family monovalent cation:H+ antiporter